MRIAFLGNFLYDYSSESHHKRSLESLGNEVIALQEKQVNSVQIYNTAITCDMFVWVHTHGWNTVVRRNLSMVDVLRRLKKAGIPTVTYHLDLWFGLDRQNDLNTDKFYKEIEYFFTCDKKMADWFNQTTNVKGFYLPAGVVHDELQLDDTPRTRDVIFVGSKKYHHEWPYRPQLIDWLRSVYGSRFTHVGGDGDTGTLRGKQLNDMYNSSKVAIGDTLCLGFDYPYYWSDRLYESIGRGGFTIFPYIKGIETQFKINCLESCELVTYNFNDLTQLKSQIDWYIGHDKEREDIRKRAFERVKNEHTYRHRWTFILNTVKGKTL